MITANYKAIVQWTIRVLGVATLATTGYWWTRSGNYEAACDEAAIMYGCLRGAIAVGNTNACFVDNIPSATTNITTNVQQWAYGFMPPSLPPGGWITYQSGTTTTYYASVADASGNVWSTLSAGWPQPFAAGSPDYFYLQSPDNMISIWIGSGNAVVENLAVSPPSMAYWSGSTGGGADGTYTLTICPDYSFNLPSTNSAITVTYWRVNAVTPRAITNINWRSYQQVYTNMQAQTNLVGFYPQVERYAAFLRANALYSSAWLAPSNTFFTGGSWDGHFGPAPPLLAENTAIWTNNVASNTTYGTFAFERDAATTLPYISTNALDDLVRAITLMQWQKTGYTAWKATSAKRYAWTVSWARTGVGYPDAYPPFVYMSSAWTYSNTPDVIVDVPIGTISSPYGLIPSNSPPQISWYASASDNMIGYAYPDHVDEREYVTYVFSYTVINSSLVVTNGLPFDVEHGRVWAGGGTGENQITNGLDEISWTLNYPGWAMAPTNYVIITPDDWTCAASNSVSLSFPLNEGGIEAYINSLWSAENFPTDVPTNTPFLNLFGGYTIQHMNDNPAWGPQNIWYPQDSHNWGGVWSMSDPRISVPPFEQHHICFPSDPNFNDWRWSAPR